ncbi:MAG: gamma-glutamyltransferase [Candidatus Bathyarchaeota archaeon]|nr:gamma-glutamyltransferase [Candidatus Bathyarchaeota archaeon]
MVVCHQPLAAEQGVKVLARGGNAVDAAVTVGLLQGVVDPLNCSLGGTGQINIHMAKSGEDKIIEFHSRAGSKVKPEMWVDKIVAQSEHIWPRYVIEGHVSDRGYTSVMVPGEVMGLYEALHRFGTWDWHQTVEPAIKAAEEGFQVYAELEHLWRTREAGRLNATPSCEEIFTKNGEIYRVDETFVQKDLAKTLKKIAKSGPEAFYSGDIASKIAEDFSLNGGFITYDDLKNFKINVTDPLETEYRDYRVTSTPAPGGGISLLEILNILEGYDLTKYDWHGMGKDVAEYIKILSMAMRATRFDRANYVGDPEFVEVPTKKLISKSWAEVWRNRIESGEKIVVPRFSRPEHNQTTHVSVIDSNGNAASLTHTIGPCSGVVTPGLGFVYNSAMYKFDPIPGHPNSIAPGKRRQTQKAPTIIYKDGEPFMILGASGGERIMDSVLQTIINVIDHGMTAVEAVSAPRILCLVETIHVPTRVPEYICHQLESMGEEVHQILQSYAPSGSVQAIVVDSRKGKVYGGSDPRNGRGAVFST